MTDDALNEWLNERFVGAKDLAEGHTHKFNLQFARDLIAFDRLRHRHPPPGSGFVFPPQDVAIHEVGDLTLDPAPDYEPFTVCITCGGGMEYRRFHDAWGPDGETPNIEDCTEGPYCSRCEIVWIGFVKDEGDVKDSVLV